MHLNINSRFLARFVACALFLKLVAASPLPSDKPPVTVLTKEEDLLEEYDYIVIGGGTAGLVVANRLSENKDGKLIYCFLSPSVANVQFL